LNVSKWYSIQTAFEYPSKIGLQTVRPFHFQKNESRVGMVWTIIDYFMAEKSRLATVWKLRANL
jgi:hypothetical protein